MKPINIKLSKSAESSFKYKQIRLAAFDFNWHCHPEYELMLMLRSRGKRFVGDKIYFYEDGDLVFLGSNLPHTLYAPAGSLRDGAIHEAILVQFDENVAGLDVANAPELKAVRRLLDESARGVRFHGKTRDVVSDILIKMATMGGMDRLLELLTVLDLLGKASGDEVQFLSSVAFNHSLNPHQQSRIGCVCKYLNDEYKHSIRLEDAAEIANMSVTSFSRFFKKCTGKTFVKYINELRVGQACKLLIESDLTVSEVCFEVGFNNVSNFNRRFVERHAKSPTRYRQEFSL